MSVSFECDEASLVSGVTQWILQCYSHLGLRHQYLLDAWYKAFAFSHETVLSCDAKS
jgi:hypothetical protein